MLAGVDADGVVWAASGARPGGTWEQRGQLDGQPQAFAVAARGRLLAADDDGVKVSDDGGRSWRLLAAFRVGAPSGAHDGGGDG